MSYRRRKNGLPEARQAVVNHLTCVCGMPREEAEKLMPKRKGEESTRYALTPEALEVYVKATKREIADPVVRAVLLLLPLTGLRIAEITGLRHGNVTEQEGRIGWLFKGKGEKTRFVPLGRRAIAILTQYLQEIDGKREFESALFPNTRNSNAITPAAIEAACRHLAQREPALGKLTPHVLRHTYATEALRNCHDMKTLQARLGHDSLGTTLVYIHADGHEQRAR